MTKCKCTCIKVVKRLTSPHWGVGPTRGGLGQVSVLLPHLFVNNHQPASRVSQSVSHPNRGLLQSPLTPLISHPHTHTHTHTYTYRTHIHSHSLMNMQIYAGTCIYRSEERRVGRECIYRCSP